MTLLLVRFDPISLMRNKPQNAYLYKTALSPILPAFSNQYGYVALFCNDAEYSLFYEGSRLNLKTTPRTTQARIQGR